MLLSCLVPSSEWMFWEPMRTPNLHGSHPFVTPGVCVGVFAVVFFCSREWIPNIPKLSMGLEELYICKFTFYLIKSDLNESTW